MFANRYAAFIDACAMVGPLKRNLILSLAEAEFFRVRWSADVLHEMQDAIRRLLIDASDPAAAEKAARQVIVMRDAFPEADVNNFGSFMSAADIVRDPKDRHVLAAALAAGVQCLVTDNLKDFPKQDLSGLGIELLDTDAFLANTLTLDLGRSIAAVSQMRKRLNRPELTADELLLRVERNGLVETHAILRSHVASL